MRLGCPRCGTFYDGDEKFCARDGSKLVPAGLAPTPISSTPISSSIVPPPSGLPSVVPGTRKPALPRTPGRKTGPGKPSLTQTPKAKPATPLRRTTAGRVAPAPKRPTNAGERAGAARKSAHGIPARKSGQGASARKSAQGVPAKKPNARPSTAKNKPPATRKSDDGARWLAYANLEGSTFDGRYLVSRKVADGGMSSVYLAQDQERGGERVAIKILAPELSEDLSAMERLRREADMGARLAHRNVCSITRMGETSDGLVYVVMPYIDGEILCDRTYRLGAIPLPMAVWIVRDIAAGLHAAHELEIIHRDLKPENVMLCTAEDGNEFAVVMDFGLAKDREAARFLEKLTATGIVLGTPEFMSPEQLRGKPLDRRTDVYSLALLTYEMLTGKLPFKGENQQDLLLARLRSHPTPIREMRPDLQLPAEIERVLTKGLQRLPEERYATAPDFAEAVERAAKGEESVIKKLFG